MGVGSESLGVEDNHRIALMKVIPYLNGRMPGSIPNLEAKPLSADGTALVKVWESRTSPDNYSKRPISCEVGLFVGSALNKVLSEVTYQVTRCKFVIQSG